MDDFKYKKTKFKAVSQGKCNLCCGCAFEHISCVDLRCSKQIPTCYETKDGEIENFIFKIKGDKNATGI